MTDDVPRPPPLSLLQARARYFQENGFGERGGYDEPWVDFKVGPLPFPFPNTKARVRAVAYHDLHHIVTGYRTDLAGEFEISAWELGAGCKDFGAAWALNLAGVAGGLVLAPRRVFRAFVRGRRSQTMYGDAIEELLPLTVDEARARYVADATEQAAKAGDRLLFALTAIAGAATAAALMSVMLPLAPLGLVTNVLRRRAPA